MKSLRKIAYGNQTFVAVWRLWNCKLFKRWNNMGISKIDREDKEHLNLILNNLFFTWRIKILVIFYYSIDGINWTKSNISN